MHVGTARTGPIGRIALSALALALAGTLGCGTTMKVFLHPEADLAYYEKVGVVPFRSLATDRMAGEKFSLEFTTALLASEKFDVVDYGVFTNALAKTVGSKAVSRGLTVEELKKIKEATGVQGVFVGTVKEYGMGMGVGRHPVISVEARLLDTETGQVVWMATATAHGGPKVPLLGWGEVSTLGELAQRLSGELVERIR